MTKKRIVKTLKELEKIWYKKLKDGGFEDIENTGLPGRPLKVYHSYHMVSVPTQVRQAKRIPYQEQIDLFLNHHTFASACRSLAKKTRISLSKVVMVWEGHCDGKTEREIGIEVGLSKTGVHKLIEKFRQWMTVSL